MNKSKLFLIVLSVFLLTTYLFFYLGIELELKFVVERFGVKSDQLISTSFKIRNFMTIQLAIFLIVLFSNIYFFLKGK
jgi:hypothetical protein